jgi:hypothetical protein
VTRFTDRYSDFSAADAWAIEVILALTTPTPRVLVVQPNEEPLAIPSLDAALVWLAENGLHRTKRELEATRAPRDATYLVVTGDAATRIRVYDHSKAERPGSYHALLAETAGGQR